MRIMTMDDYEKVVGLWMESSGMDLNETDESYEGIRKFLERNPDTCFVHENEEGEIIGVILSGNDGRRGMLHHLAVREGYRRKGIGRMLAEAAIDSLKKKGIARVGLFIYNDNDLGISFWKEMGFIREDAYAYYDRDLIELSSLKK